MNEFKKGDLLIHYHNFYSPIIVMEDGLQEKMNCDTSISGGVITQTNINYTMGVSARSISMRQDYIYDKLDSIKCNLGPMTFEEFYSKFEELVPEYAIGIKEHFDLQVRNIEMLRERKYGTQGDTQKEMYIDKMRSFPLS